MSSGFAAALAKREGEYHRAAVHRTVGQSSPTQATPPLTPKELRALIDPVLGLMKTFTVYDVMGSSTQVIVVSEDSTLTVAFIAGQESRVNSCTLWSPKQKKFVGVLTVSDYVRILLRCHSHPADAEQLATSTIREWRLTHPSANAPDTLVAAYAEEPLVDAIQRMLEKQVNRMPVFAEELGSSPTPTLISMLTFGQILTHLSLTLFADAASVVALTGLQPALSPAASPSGAGSPNTPQPALSIFDMPIGSLGFATLSPSYKQTAVMMHHTVFQTLTMLIEHGHHALPVIDDRNIIIDVISRNDVIRLETGGIYDVSKTLAEALSYRVGTRVAVFSLSDTLREVTLHFLQNGLHSMFCVDEHDAVIGHLSLVAIVKFFFAAVQHDESPAA